MLVARRSSNPLYAHHGGCRDQSPSGALAQVYAFLIPEGELSSYE